MLNETSKVQESIVIYGNTGFNPGILDTLWRIALPL